MTGFEETSRKPSSSAALIVSGNDVDLSDVTNLLEIPNTGGGKKGDSPFSQPSTIQRSTNVWLHRKRALNIADALSQLLDDLEGKSNILQQLQLHHSVSIECSAFGAGSTEAVLP